MVSVSLIDFALAPPLGVLNPFLDAAGPYGPGNHILSTWNNSGVIGPVANTFGVVVQINGAIAPKLSRLFGFDDGGTVNTDLFSDRLVQVVVEHQFLSGAWIVSQLVDVHFAPFLIRWSEALPGRVGLYVLPTLSVDLYYLLT